MTAAEIIQEIKRLPGEEQSKVFEFVRAQNERLSPQEIGKLAHRMVASDDPAEADRLQEEIIRGFYGKSSGA